MGATLWKNRIASTTSFGMSKRLESKQRPAQTPPLVSRI
jgi:hypothetical protein